MQKILALLLCFLYNFCFSQNDSLATPDTKKILSPTLGIGTGTLSFLGDVHDFKYPNPLIARLATDLRVNYTINSFLSFKLNFLYGKLELEERTKERNYNFQSTFSAGAVYLTYNFANFLNENRIIEPNLSLGFEGIEFSSKTDLYDKYGNRYYYWSDGSIRNLPESDPDANNAIILQRDYVYETDLRELNLDSLGKYPQRTFALPVELGAKIYLSKHVQFKLSTSLHFTFTDLIDNITVNSKNELTPFKSGNKAKDKILYTSVALYYDFKIKKEKEEQIAEPENEDFLALDNEDYDNDGVRDFDDQCAGTPKGVEVDEKGCPLDEDNDGVPDYLDEEPGTTPGSIVDSKGVELSDTVIYQKYLAFIDSTGIHTKIKKRTFKQKKKKYMVQVGTNRTTITEDEINKILSLPDVQIHTFGDTLTVYTVGEYKKLPEAVKRQVQLEEEGISANVIKEKESENGNKKEFELVDTVKTNEIKRNLKKEKEGAVIFRIQLGAFKSTLKPENFPELENIIIIQDADGYSRVFTGAYSSFEEAAKKKIDVIALGYKDAFIKAFKKGKNITLKEAGVKVAEGYKAPEPKIDAKKGIYFKVQLGVYQNEVPIDVVSKFLKLGDVEPVENETEKITKYFIGNFKNYEEAQKMKERAIKLGLDDAFIKAYQDGNEIEIKKALELLKK